MEPRVSRLFLDIAQLKEARCPDESPHEPEWAKHDRHFFIITDAARPVYCRYGNEVNVTPLLCTIVALTGQLARDGDQRLKTVVAGDKVFVFYVPLPFIFAAVSSANVPVSLLEKELHVLEHVIFSLLTPQIKITLQKRPNFDIKRQTVSAERYFTSVLHLMDHFLPFIVHECVPMAAMTDKREGFANVVRRASRAGVYAVIVFWQGCVFFTAESPQFHFSPDDIRVLLNNTYAAESQLNTWTPISLPDHSDILHILSTETREPFQDLKMTLIADQIEAAVEATKMADHIQNEWFAQFADFRPQPIEAVDVLPAEIVHWMLADRGLHQVYAPYAEAEESDVIYRNYAWVYDYLKQPANAVNGQFYIAGEELTVFGWHQGNETILAATKRGCPAGEANQLFGRLREFVVKNKRMILDLRPVKLEAVSAG
jgi:hypothetical protein